MTNISNDLVNPLKMSNHPITSCALCTCSNIQSQGDFVNSPLANNLYSNVFESLSAPKYPLGLVVCMECGHLQLSYEVNPIELFQNYTYKSGVSSALKHHFSELAHKLQARYLMDSDKAPAILDVGCNDGCLLDSFGELGFRTFGFEPAKNLLEEINPSHTIFNDFFDTTTVRDHSLFNIFDLITANNVFAHTRNLSGFAQAAAHCLSKEGIFVFEVQYLRPLIEQGLFDMIYHEHTSYHHLTPLVKTLPKYGLNVFDAELISTHGGSIRVYCSKGVRPLSQSALEILSLERDFFGESPFDLVEKVKQFYFNAQKNIKELDSLLISLIPDESILWAYTSPAKATTWASVLSPMISASIQFIVDDSDLKQNQFLPGTSAPIVSTSTIKTMFSDHEDFLNRSVGIIFAWNIFDSLRDKLIDQHLGSGKFIVPMPRPRMVKLF